MPYPEGHRDQTRAKIVASARRLFNRHGFDNVSLDQIMAGASLTRGGFYSYFSGKSDLYAEVLGCFFTDPEWQNCWEGVEVDLASKHAGPQVVRAYLSRQHFEDVENSCPMVALPSDVTRGSEKAKKAFETVFQAMVSVLARSVAGQGRRRQSKAEAIAALCVGGMVVARALAHRDLADQLRERCMSVAMELGGWNTAPPRTHRNSPAKHSGQFNPKSTRGDKSVTTRRGLPA
ncbi:MAG TPA: TetR/AcrR family transcriptional regulator [Acidobacteriaceae bacterium]|jgi:AcrR family transcriptional regulator|nr:TetR/AcrR family transcriptional regulator [Acidobacteriaceae bacterium]